MSTPSSYASSPAHALSPGVSTPGLAGGGASLAPSSSATKAPAAPQVKPKVVNVFSNDGSFLERFQRSKKEEDEKKKQEEILARKRAFDDRFKKRGKRKITESTPAESSDSAPPAKKAKELTQYEKEVKSYEGRSLKDQGIGVRPLVK